MRTRQGPSGNREPGNTGPHPTLTERTRRRHAAQSLARLAKETKDDAERYAWYAWATRLGVGDRLPLPPAGSVRLRILSDLHRLGGHLPGDPQTYQIKSDEIVRLT